MTDTDTRLTDYEGFTYKELHERFPDRAEDLIGLVEKRRQSARCDLCGAPLGDAANGSQPPRAKIVGFSRCSACVASA